MKKLLRTLTDLALVLLSITLSLLLVMLALYAAGYPAHLILFEWLKGSLWIPHLIGEKFDLMVALKNSAPLILTGLAAGIAFRSGVFNIGAQGQALLGGIFTVTLATRLLPALTPNYLAIPLALLAGALGGALWAMIAALLDRYRGVPIVLSTILLNFIALFLLGILLEGPLKAAHTQMIQSDRLPHAYWLPVLVKVGVLHAGILVALAAVLLAWILQSRTSLGFELLVVGLSPTAANLAGMPVASRQLQVMLLSGAFAGLAGTIQVLGVEGHFMGPSAEAYGYAGIAVALLGRLHPLGTLLAALFFAMLDQGASNVEISQYALPHEIADIVKGLIVLVILVTTAYVARLRTASKEH